MQTVNYVAVKEVFNPRHKSNSTILIEVHLCAQTYSFTSVLAPLLFVTTIAPLIKTSLDLPYYNNTSPHFFYLSLRNRLGLYLFK